MRYTVHCFFCRVHQWFYPIIGCAPPQKALTFWFYSILNQMVGDFVLSTRKKEMLVIEQSLQQCKMIRVWSGSKNIPQQLRANARPTPKGSRRFPTHFFKGLLLSVSGSVSQFKYLQADSWLISLGLHVDQWVKTKGLGPEYVKYQAHQSKIYNLEVAEILHQLIPSLSHYLQGFL